jgi:hypothetical protein
LHWVLLSRKSHNRTLFFSSKLCEHSRHFDTETSLWTCACASVT